MPDPTRLDKASRLADQYLEDPNSTTVIEQLNSLDTVSALVFLGKVTTSDDYNILISLAKNPVTAALLEQHSHHWDDYTKDSPELLAAWDYLGIHRITT